MEAEKLEHSLHKQVQIKQEKFAHESPRQKTEFEQQMKQVEAKRLADSDAFQRDIEVRRLEVQQVIDEQRLEMEADHQANNHAASVGDQEREAFEQNFHLPTLSLPKFSVSVLQWKWFWDPLQAAVHNKLSVSPITKFN